MSPRLSFRAVVIACELVERDAEALAVVGDEAAQVVHRAVEALCRVGHFVGRVGQHGGDVGQVGVERGEQIAARRQCGHQQLQVAHRAEDVGAVVAERRNRLRELDDRVARGIALAAQVVRGGVDELAHRARPAGRGGLQRVGELLQLLTEVVPLDRNRGAFLRNRRAGSQFRAAGVCRDELDRPRADQRRRQDRRLGVGGHRVLSVDRERHLRARSAAVRSSPRCRRRRRGCGPRRRCRGRWCWRSRRRRCPGDAVPPRRGHHGDRDGKDDDEARRERDPQRHASTCSLPSACGRAGPAARRSAAVVRPGAGPSAGGPGGGPPGGGAGSGSRYG